MFPRTTSPGSWFGPTRRSPNARAKPRPLLSHPRSLLLGVRCRAFAGRIRRRQRAAPPRRLHGSVTLDPKRVGRNAGRIADEAIAHLAGLVGSSAKVTLEIEAEIEVGAPQNVVRTVTENSRTLNSPPTGWSRNRDATVPVRG